MPRDSDMSKLIVSRLPSADPKGAARRCLRHRMMVVVVLVGLLAVGAMPAFAATGFNLGPPTNATSSNPYFPLSGFHKAGPSLRSHGLPELLWIGTAWPGDAASDWERWPVVKALEQFGTFLGVVPAQPGCGKPEQYGGGLAGPGPVEKPCSLPTFDWTYSHFNSPYVVFVPRELLGGRGHLLDRLTPEEARLFDWYVRLKPGGSALAVGASISGGIVDTSYATARQLSHHFPLLSIDGYLQTVTQVAFVADMVANPADGSVSGLFGKGLPYAYYHQPLSFNTVRTALATGRAPSIAAFHQVPGATLSSLVPDINAETNVITALICRADGKRPTSVCGRSVIEGLMRRAT